MIGREPRERPSSDVDPPPHGGEASGDRSEWVKAALRDHEAPLLRYCLRLLHGDLETARDVVQDAFIKLWKQDMASLNGHLAPWLYRVCRNRCTDVLRKEGRMRFVLDDISTARPAGANPSLAGAAPTAGTFSSGVLTAEFAVGSPADAAAAPERHSGLLRALAFLPERQREALRLKFQAELSYKEIAEVLELTVPHVGVLIHTGLRSLREMLAQRDADQPRAAIEPAASAGRDSNRVSK